MPLLTCTTINGNTANSNTESGIYLEGLFGSCDNNEVIGNTVKNNKNGIYLDNSDRNTISDNTANENSEIGIIIEFSSYNTIKGNSLIGNNECIDQDYPTQSQANTFENNDCGVISGYNVIFLISILTIASVLIVKRIKKSRKIP